MSSRAVIVIFAFAVCFAVMAAANAGTCFKTREKSVGAFKVCFYDCAREQASIIIHGGEICPLTIESGEGDL